MHSAFFVLLFTSAPAAALAATYAGSPAEQAARGQGYQLLRELPVDIDGDGTDEIGAVERRAGKMRVVVLDPTGSEELSGGFRRIAETELRRGQTVLRLEARRMAGTRAPELLAVIEDRTPDERGLNVSVMSAAGKGIQEIFQKTFFVPNETAPDPNTVAFAEVELGFFVEDLEKDGSDEEVVWVRTPQRLVLPGRDGPVTVIVGMVRTIYRFDAMKSRYVVATENDVVDLMPARTVSGVEASDQVAKIWGTAQAFWVADADLETSWNVKLKGAEKQSIQLKLEGRPEVSLIRIVPGCGSTDDDWQRHHSVRTFDVSLGSGLRFTLDRQKLTPLPRGVRAAGEFPLGEGFGAQILVLLDERQALPWARFGITALEKPRAPRRTVVDEVCVSEISLH